MFYKSVSFLIDPETKAKITLTGDLVCQDLLDLFHPCQLEKRFGGTAETPTNFWPPYVGPVFEPENSD